MREYLSHSGKTLFHVADIDFKEGKGKAVSVLAFN
jgi:hypothetical protein